MRKLFTFVLLILGMSMALPVGYAQDGEIITRDNVSDLSIATLIGHGNVIDLTLDPTGQFVVVQSTNAVITYALEDGSIIDQVPLNSLPISIPDSVYYIDDSLVVIQDLNNIILNFGEDDEHTVLLPSYDLLEGALGSIVVLTSIQERQLFAYDFLSKRIIWRVNYSRLSPHVSGNYVYNVPSDNTDDKALAYRINIEDGTTDEYLPSDYDLPDYDYLLDFTVIDDGRFVAFQTSEGFFMFETKTQEAIFTFPNRGRVQVIDNEQVLIRGDDTLYLWSDGKIIWEIPRNTFLGRTHDIEQGNLLNVNDSNIFLYHLMSHEKVAELGVLAGSPQLVAFDTDNNVSYMTQGNRLVHIDEQGNATSVTETNERWTDMFYSDERLVLIGDVVHIYDEHNQLIDSFDEAYTLVAVSDQYLAYVADSTGPIIVHSLDNLSEPILSLEQTDGLSALLITEDTLYGGFLGGVQSWDLATGNPIQTFEGGRFIGPDQLVANDEFLFASSGVGGNQVYDVATGELLYEPLNMQAAPALPDLFLNDMLVLGTEFYDPETGEQISEFFWTRGGDTINDISFSADGTQIVIAHDASISIWVVE